MLKKALQLDLIFRHVRIWAWLFLEYLPLFLSLYLGLDILRLIMFLDQDLAVWLVGLYFLSSLVIGGLIYQVYLKKFFLKYKKRRILTKKNLISFEHRAA